MKKAFTLVELIVVITILAILATIGFVSFSGYLAGARDTNRAAQLKSMSDALELYTTKKSLPIPDDKVDIKTGVSPNEKTIAYQGYVGKNVLETIEYTESGLDPKDKTYFTYYLSKNKKYFQLMAFLEEENEDVIAFASEMKAIDYSSRKFIVKGKRLGVLIDGDNNPIQTVPVIIGSGFLNVGTTTDIYKAILENGFELEGTGSELKMLAGTALVGGVKNSCKDILAVSSKVKGEDGYYLINQKLPTKVYCDMTTKGGGWSRYVDIKGDYSFADAKQCWLAKRNRENAGKTIECYNPNRLSFVVDEFMVKEDVDGDGDKDSDETWFKKFKNSYPSQIEKISHASRRCKGGREYMTVMGSSGQGYPNNTLSNISYVRLGLSYCTDDAYREIGGVNTTPVFMNYSYTGQYGPKAGKAREAHTKKIEIYIK